MRNFFVMKKVLIVHAIELERIPLQIKGAETKTVLSGIGKANAAMNVMQAVLEFKPDYVLNIGTSGTLNHEVGDILVSNHFIDRDMVPLQAFGLDYEIRTAVPEGLNLCSVVGGQCVSGDYIVNTGDDFVTADSGITGDAVDMEAFAEAMVCRKMNLPFVSIKYITDVIGQNSVKVWEDKLTDARHGVVSFLQKNDMFSIKNN